jgi:hypothetical protein
MNPKFNDMEIKANNENRRDFLKILIPAGAVLCMGCPTALSMNAKNNLNQEQDFDTKIKNEFSISWEEFFMRRYSDRIAWMKTFADSFGKDEVINIIKEQSDKWNLEREPNLDATSVKDFFKPILTNEYFKNCLENEFVEFSDKIVQMRVTKCLWAKTFMSKEAGEFGYASVCHGDFTAAKAFNPKLKMERTKTLMEGHDCCNHRYTWEG